MGAWIEIKWCGLFYFGFLSLLSWERGLKYRKCNSRQYRHRLVAPLVGAWIEMLNNCFVNSCNNVAPLVGAWIEIFCASVMTNIVVSLLSWERGLKYGYDTYGSQGIRVAPLVGAWIEIA